jgi:cell division protein ZipA
MQMDAATLRLILLAFGIAFLVALYFWERYRAARAGAADARDSEARHQTSSRIRREPNLGLEDETSPEQALPSPVSNCLDEPKLSGTITRNESGLIIQIFLVASQRVLSGLDILTASSRHALIPGDRDIFHCYDGDPERPHWLFSMANLVQPGHFPLQPSLIAGMSDFETRGLAFFTRVNGQPNDIDALDSMLRTAESLALELNANVEDAHHQPITIERVESLRACILNLQSPSSAHPR